MHYYYGESKKGASHARYVFCIMLVLNKELLYCIVCYKSTTMAAHTEVTKKK